MTSGEGAGGAPAHGGGWDDGLLAPSAVGTAAEAATGDRAVLQALLDAEAGLVRARCRLGAAPAGAGETVTSVARAEHFDIRSLALRARSGGNPVIPLVADLSRAVAERVPEHGEFVHRGATSQDILDTALMLVADRALNGLTADLRRAADTLGALAARHRATLMPGRTLTQHAVPTTFGLKAAGWRSLVLDAHDRLVRVRRSLPAQLGGAAGTLAAFAHDAGVSGVGACDVGLPLVAAFADELGLAEPELPWHVLRTPVADLGAALAFCAGALGKLAADVLVLGRTEIGEVAEGAGGGSSAMPHKRNPVRATLIASVARQVPALAGVLFEALAAEDERPAGAWHAEWQPLRQALRLTGGAAEATAAMCAGLVVFPERMRANLDLTGGLLLTERIAAHLAPLVGRDTAKSRLAEVSRRVADQGVTLAAAIDADPVLGPALSPARLRRLTAPSLATGSAPALTDRALRRAPLSFESHA
ncbi:3-carboxy-cis,cis-muconate cycloisomerase [Streptomyces sp. CBMA29]|uniref:3-carboxy-cis,cis-muconate cycloisomerase n=1 Tax=Streptomyces sp. CBMA29 TaxID=1896314 RepID=UPI001661E0A3|nr:3-carboxy-cis,cis-muconate cycloisomerase [Streptomyces sp. CBMA29]MBD0735616.1 3-carboxy-cis,cis-muconate cycloisomerase [Streptomyces sp. CBMA29]